MTDNLLYGTNHVLPILLPLAIEMRINEIKARGGITERDVTRIQSYIEDLAAHGDDLLYRAKKKGETARYFNQLADAIAVMAFLPGGIKVFGEHYEVKAS
jgi:hypothetical protein